MPRLRVATRGSELARRQTDIVVRRLGVEVDIVVVSTTGDQKADAPIHTLGGTGVFVKEVQGAVLAGGADLAVHSAKDLPSITVPGFVLGVLQDRFSHLGPFELRFRKKQARAGFNSGKL